MKKLSLLILFAALLISCDKETPTGCGTLYCDASFKLLTVDFVNNQGLGVPISNYSAVNLRTNEKVFSELSASVNTTPGTFVVLDDGYRKNLSATGDDIKITGTYDDTKQTKSVIIKVANPVCGCHFEKISGEQIVKFD
ncbi:MAG: hypothetical protein WKF66_01045 [Pedobacter sp.]